MHKLESSESGFCEKMKVTRVPPGRPSRIPLVVRVPQVGNACYEQIKSIYMKI